MRKEIESILDRQLGAGMYDWGFADMRGLLDREYEEFGWAVSILRRLDDAVIDGIADGPTTPYYLHYNEVNSLLNGAVAALERFITGLGAGAHAKRATLSESEIKQRSPVTLRTNFSHKMAATRAGLGWIGKTDLLVSKKFGPRVRLASVLVKDRLLEPDEPISEERCGDCDLCVRECPAGAANGRPWDVHTDRDEFFDPHRCRSKCRELSKSMIDKDISLCGICVSICPLGGG